MISTYPHSSPHDGDLYKWYHLRVQQQQHGNIGEGPCCNQLHWTLTRVLTVLLLYCLKHHDRGLARNGLPVAVGKDGATMGTI